MKTREKRCRNHEKRNVSSFNEKSIHDVDSITVSNKNDSNRGLRSQFSQDLTVIEVLSSDLKL